MVAPTSLLTLALAGLTTAHYAVFYPEWRGDSLDEENTGFNQWNWPCAGAPYGEGNRTDWPLTGGSVNMSLGHAYNFLYINLGLESADGNVTSFDVSLTPLPLNTTGHGNLCLRNLTIPDGVNITNGANASLQFVKVGQSGNAMYNCADIRFSEDAELLSEDTCTDGDEDAQWAVLEDQESFDGDGHGGHGGHGDDDEEEGGDSESEESNEDDDSAAPVNLAGVGTMVSVGLAVVFAVNL